MKSEIKERIVKVNNGEIPEGYTQKGVSVILPDDWKYNEMSSFIKLVSGQHIAAEDYNIIGKGVPYLTGPADFNQRYIFKTKYTEKPKTMCHEGDILITVKGSGVGKTIISDDVYCISRQLMAITGPKHIIDILYQNLKLNETTYSNNSAGLIPGISRLDILNKKISLPHNDQEMVKIASILSTWDKALELKEQLIGEKKRQKKGLMKKLLTGEVRLPRFDGEWKEVRLGDVCEFKNGKGHEKNINVEGRYIVVNSKFVSSEGNIYKKSDANLCPLYNGDITMVMSDVPNGKAFAKCFLIDEDNRYTLNQRICSLKATKVNNLFMFYSINRADYFLKFDNGVGQTNLRKEEVLNCPIYMPSIIEQEKIVACLSLVDKQIQLIAEELSALKLQKKGLMQLLLTGIVRVQC